MNIACFCDLVNPLAFRWFTPIPESDRVGGQGGRSGKPRSGRLSFQRDGEFRLQISDFSDHLNEIIDIDGDEEFNWEADEEISDQISASSSCTSAALSAQGLHSNIHQLKFLEKSPSSESVPDISCSSETGRANTDEEPSNIVSGLDLKSVAAMNGSYGDCQSGQLDGGVDHANLVSDNDRLLVDFTNKKKTNKGYECANGSVDDEEMNDSLVLLDSEKNDSSRTMMIRCGDNWRFCQNGEAVPLNGFNRRTDSRR
ncbi:hypothetical protein ACLOJK_032528 [Asimina triloba]